MWLTVTLSHYWVSESSYRPLNTQIRSLRHDTGFRAANTLHSTADTHFTHFLTHALQHPLCHIGTMTHNCSSCLSASQTDGPRRRLPPWRHACHTNMSRACHPCQLRVNTSGRIRAETLPSSWQTDSSDTTFTSKPPAKTATHRHGGLRCGRHAIKTGQQQRYAKFWIN